MAEIVKDQTNIKLREGSRWSSFEQFRKEGASALDSVKNGTIATLLTKNGQYRILEEKDFQRLYGLARDVERLRGGVQVVLSAAEAVQKHRDNSTIQVLVNAVSLVGSSPILPIRDSFESMDTEGLELAEDDEVILDPARLESPLG
jgi:hypothetical protein